MVFTLSCTGVARLFLALHDILDSMSSPVHTPSSVDARQDKGDCSGAQAQRWEHGITSSVPEVQTRSKDMRQK